jgi:hypothetical protein
MKQTPTKFQISNILQIPTLRLLYRVWNFGFKDDLKFGVWNWGFRTLLATSFLLFPFAACAHIGDQNVFFEGNAGPYPVRVVIRPPGVIPGLAEISVRVNANGAKQVTVLPMRWDSARQGAPPPDEAKLVRGETNLFNTQLWFMRGGAQSVEIAISGAVGVGKVIVPVNAIATRVLGMPRGLGWVLAGLGLVLVGLAASIIGAGVRESVLASSEVPTKKRRWRARGTVAFAAIGLTTFLWFGKNWWDAEANDYRNNRLHRSLSLTPKLAADNGARILTVEREIDSRRRNGPLVPDHGKLMHLFLIREANMDVFAHLHPIKRDWKTFDVTLPPLPAGEYSIYGDVTYETGLAETLIGKIALSNPGTATAAGVLDTDDSWKLAQPLNGAFVTNKHRVALSTSLWMDMSLEGPLIEDRDTRLRFAVRDAILRSVKLDHFMGMAGHLILRRNDGTVFTHLHPSGSFSMAAQQLFELRAEGKAPLKVASSKADPLCRLPPPDATTNTMLHEEISFPYAFPKSGSYRLWAQVKVRGEVLTGVFDVNVAPAHRRFAKAGFLQ